MKKLLSILVLSLLFSSSAEAFIYDCKIKDTFDNKMRIEANFIINVDNISEAKALITVERNTGKFKEGDIIISKGTNSSIGQIIITSQTGGFLQKGSYKLFVTRSNKPGSDNYFTAIFEEPSIGQSIIHTITISPWDKNVYFFLSDKPKKVFKGTCK